MAKTEAIDLTSDEPILEYIEGKSAGNGVPARDLNGGDLAHITEVELLAEADHRAEDFVRPHVTPGAAAKVAGRLIKSGAFRVIKKPAAPRAAKAPAKSKGTAKAATAPEPTTQTPVEPAAAPEE